MNTKFLGLRTTIYKVQDLLKSTEWYAKVFQEKPYFNESYYVGFNIAGYELGLIADETVADQKKESVLTYWGVDDVKKEYSSMIQLGAEEYEKPHNVGGDIVVAAVKDPWGNILGIIYNPDFQIS